MLKKILSFSLAFLLALSCINFSFTASARDVAVGGGAESFNPVEFYQTFSNYVGKTIDTTFTVKVTDRNYKIRINLIGAFLPYYSENTVSSLNVDVEKGVIVEDMMNFRVTGTVAAGTNTTVRYTVEYDILDKSGNVVWKNLLGYGYGHISTSEEEKGAIGTYYGLPGKLSDGCYFEILETLNTTYVQVREESLYYKIRTQVGWPWNYQGARTRGVNVISGNAPSTLKTMPDNPNTARPGQMDWPEANGTYHSDDGDWIRWTEPPSGYYNFTISFNSWNNDWEDQTNITETTEMYYLSDADRESAREMAEKILGVNAQLTSGYYVQYGKYTAKSWNNLISALDMAYQVAYSVPGANYGFKIACQNASGAVSALEKAFKGLTEASHDFYKYKDPYVKEPTCTESGATVFTCICGEEKSETIPANGHKQGGWNIVTVPTCKTEGLEEVRCTVCDEVVEEKSIAVVSHNYVKTVTPPTCTESGYTTNVCSECGDTFTDEYVDTAGHSYETVVTVPTCTEKGFTTYTCTVCSDTYDGDYVDATGHDYEATVIEPTKTEEGYTVYQCKNCDDNYKDDFVPALGLGETVSGTVKTFATNAENSETVETKIELIRVGEVEAAYTTSVAGTGVQNYSLEDVDEGDYILRVSKENHATREYGITVSSEDITVELVIHLTGDINGDGKVNTVDTAKVNARARGVSALEGYEFACADSNNDNKINTVDVARINAHARGATFLW